MVAKLMSSASTTLFPIAFSSADSNTRTKPSTSDTVTVSARVATAVSSDSAARDKREKARRFIRSNHGFSRCSFIFPTHDARTLSTKELKAPQTWLRKCTHAQPTPPHHQPFPRVLFSVCPFICECLTAFISPFFSSPTSFFFNNRFPAMPRVSRVVVLGSSTVGKSALIAALLGQAVDTAEYDPTTEVRVWRTNACIPSLSPTHNPSDVCHSPSQPFPRTVTATTRSSRPHHAALLHTGV